MKLKKGISLIVLVITIVVILILLSVTTIGVKESLDNSKLTAFAKELSDLQEKCKSYYYENNELPYFDINPISQDGIINLVNNKNKELILKEMELNQDKVVTGTEGEYYVISLEKLGVKKSKRGTKKVENDVYVISYPSMNIYYLKGVKAKGTTYFSLTKNLSKIINIKEPELQEVAPVIIKNLPGVTIKKKVKVWSNTFGISISAYLNVTDEIYITLPDGVERKLNLPSNFNDFEINDLESMKLLGALTITDQEILSFKTQFNTLAKDKKKIIFTKKENSKIVGTVEIDISNYDYLAPVITNNQINMTLNLENVNTKFAVKDDLSGIKEVRFFPVLDPNIDQNVLINTYNIEFMKSRGKKAKLDASFNVDFNFSSQAKYVMIAVFDKAGNVMLYAQKNIHYSPYIFQSNISTNAVTLNSNGTSELELTVKNHDNDFHTNKNIDYAVSIENPIGGQVDNVDFSLNGVNSTNDRVVTKIAGDAAHDDSNKVKLIVPTGKKLYNKQDVKVKVEPIDNPKLVSEFKVSIENKILKDYSGNGLDANLMSGLKVVQDPDGKYALEFDGIDDYAIIPTIPAAINSKTGMRVELVATWQAFNNNSRILSLGSGENNDTIYVQNYANTGQILFRLNTYNNAHLDIYSKSTSAIELNKKAKFYLRWVQGGTGEGGTAGWYRGDIDKDNIAIDRAGTGMMYGINPISTDTRSINYIGRSGDASDGFFKGKLYSIKLVTPEWKVILDYDLNR
ncbi:MAG: hypothetical protein RSA08_01125 [Clostridia bacterium]